MTYRIVIQPAAQVAMEEAFRWVQERAPARAARWYNGLVEAINSLATFPERCPLAPEANAFDEEIRQLLYGKRADVYRILFTIQQEIVSVLYVRHGARKFLEP
jgi:plasmid stabilization system protein ParE